MTAYLYIWDRTAQKWAVRNIFDSEEAARVEGRRLWREGAPGVRIDVVVTKVENIREHRNT